MIIPLFTSAPFASLQPIPASAYPTPYEPPTLTPLGAWTAVTLNISIPIGLNNVYNSSPFDTEF
ncbi:hypothetical protein [Deinococcus sp. Leaf326]|uniref:hypothetical protein n=1 Tax=Deinococcus sp. Leaf326 TaxID=1736338 RepID=UPI0012E10CAA|nr:hypothetical protein [Deinococcus sp. Leaf326]